jgi:hypothetical protein
MIDLAVQTEYRLDGFIVNLLSIEGNFENHIDWAWEDAPANPKNDVFTQAHHNEVIKAIESLLDYEGFKASKPITSDDLDIDIVDLQIVKVGA